MRRSVLIAIPLAALLQGCVTTPAPEPVAGVEEQRALEVARQTLSRDREAGLRLLREFVEAWPRSPLADDAAYSLGRVALKRGDREEAAEWFDYILRKHASGDHSDSASLALARLEDEKGDPERARFLLKRLRFSRLEDDEKLAAHQLLSDLATSPVERVRWLAGVRAATVSLGKAGQVTKVDRQIDALLEEMSADELERIAEQLEPRIPAARVHMRLAERALSAGDVDRGSRELGRAERLEIAGAYREALVKLGQRVDLQASFSDAEALPSFSEVASLPTPQTLGASGTLGVLLPLTGPFASYGEESLRGILLAARIYDADSKLRRPSVSTSGPGLPALAIDGCAREGIRLLVRDSGGTPERAAAAVRSMARHRDLVAIIGPLLSAEAEAAAEGAEDAGVPLLTLTSREEVPRMGRYVFRLRTTPRDEVRYLVDHAVGKLAARRFAILYPQDNYGRGMRDQFWQVVEELGGHVVAVSSYSPEATDFADAIRRMIGYSLLTRGEKVALKERDALMRRARRLLPEKGAIARKVAYQLLGPEGDPLPPIIDFDALFIPDSYEKVVLIAPQLAFHEVEGVQLLGTGAWSHPDLLRIARKHVRGAVISVPFHPDSQFPFVAKFVERFRRTFGAAPDRFAAQAFDAASLVLVQLAAGLDSRSSVRDGVLRTQAFPGVSGVTTLLPDGNARKRPFLLGVKGRRWVSLD